MNAQVGIAAAFVAGLASFLSPCVLPMIPGYVSFLAGLANVPAGAERRSGPLVVSALLFVAGFTAVFVALGSTASILGMALVPYKPLLSRIAGVLVIFFGVMMTGIIRTPSIYREFRIDPARARGLGTWTAPAMGAAFAFGWTPCVGPILGSILVLAGSGSSVGAGAGLLLAYSVGLGLPFVLFALFIERLKPVLGWLKRHSVAVSRIGGIVLVIFGLGLATGTLGRVTALIAGFVPAIGG